MDANIQRNMTLIIGGVLVLVVGIILADVVIDTATTALTNASIGSFAGASSVGGLLPLIYFMVVIMIGVAMMGIGAKGFLTFAPVLVAFATPFPGAMMVAALVAFAAVATYRAYMQSRRYQQSLE